MIVSVHLPKTGGVSFRSALQSVFGEQLLCDYEDKPIHQARARRALVTIYGCGANLFRDFSNVSCIHGHFLPLKYALLEFRQDVQVVTWMRHPVDRLISHYMFWNTKHTPHSLDSLHHRVLSEQWSLERFCFSAELRNLYSAFLWGFPLRRFDFVGITEHFDQDLQFFASNYLGRALPATRENVTRYEDPSVHQLDEDLRSRIEAFHGRDMELYHQAVKLREIRVQRYG